MIKEYACNAEDPDSIPETGESPMEKGMAIHSSIVVWRSHGQRRLAGFNVVHGITKSQTRLSDKHTHI